jgi:hypothetical protein
MTKDEILSMAKEAGLSIRHFAEPPKPYDLVAGYGDALERFAALVAEKEREVCAKVCDDRAFQFRSESPFFVEMHGLADAIRARGQA